MPGAFGGQQGQMGQSPFSPMGQAMSQMNLGSMPQVPGGGGQGRPPNPAGQNMQPGVGALPQLQGYQGGSNFAAQRNPNMGGFNGSQGGGEMGMGKGGEMPGGMGDGGMQGGSGGKHGQQSQSPFGGGGFQQPSGGGMDGGMTFGASPNQMPGTLPPWQGNNMGYTGAQPEMYNPNQGQSLPLPPMLGTPPGGLMQSPGASPTPGQNFGSPMGGGPQQQPQVPQGQR